MHRRVPSCTASTWTCRPALVELPGGHPVVACSASLNDQQCCPWYVHLLPDSSHEVVCARPEFDVQLWHTLEDVSTPRDLAVCASSFETFMLRFWVENTLWFAARRANR